MVVWSCGACHGNGHAESLRFVITVCDIKGFSISWIYFWYWLNDRHRHRIISGVWKWSHTLKLPYLRTALLVLFWTQLCVEIPLISEDGEVAVKELGICCQECHSFSQRFSPISQITDLQLVGVYACCWDFIKTNALSDRGISSYNMIACQSALFDSSKRRKYASVLYPHILQRISWTLMVRATWNPTASVQHLNCRNGSMNEVKFTSAVDTLCWWFLVGGVALERCVGFGIVSAVQKTCHCHLSAFWTLFPRTWIHEAMKSMGRYLLTSAYHSCESTVPKLRRQLGSDLSIYTAWTTGSGATVQAVSPVIQNLSGSKIGFTYWSWFLFRGKREERSIR